METSERKEPRVTMASLAPILKLDKLQLQAAIRALGPCEGNNPLPRCVVFRVLLADMLERLDFLKPSQRQAILAKYDEVALVPGFIPWQTLAFADGKWCTWTGHQGWFDLTDGETVQELPAPPVETIGYNLKTLYQRACAQIEKRQQNAQHHAGSVEEPGNVRVGAADAVS